MDNHCHSNPKFEKPVKGRNSASDAGYRAVRAENGSDSPIKSDICPVRQVDGLFEFRVGDVRGNARPYSTFVMRKVAVKVVPSGFWRRAVQFMVSPSMAISHHSRFSVS